MKDELNRYIAILKTHIATEEAKVVPDVDKLEALQENLYYLDKSVIAMQWVDIEIHAQEAERLCNKSSQLIDEHVELISLATIGEVVDTQGLYS